MTQQIATLLQSMATALQANPALAEQQLSLLRQALPNADETAAREIIAACATPALAPEELMRRVLPLIARLLPNPS